MTFNGTNGTTITFPATSAFLARTDASQSFTGLQTFLNGITADQITSTVATGTPPLVIASTTNVPNLNASSLNGQTFAAPGPIGGGTAAAGNFTTVGVTGQITSTLATGTPPLVVASTTRVLNLTATNLLGGHATSATDTNIGITGSSTTVQGVYGFSTSGVGVQGDSSSNYGVEGTSVSSFGVYGASAAGGVYGLSTNGYGMVAQSATVTPTLAAFRIVPQGAIPTGPNQVGDIYITAAGLEKICTVAGSPGTWSFDVSPATTAVQPVQLQMVGLFPTVASAATLDIFGAVGATLSVSGTTTVTAITACTAGQVGSSKTLIPSNAAGFSVTATANIVVDGATSGTYLMPLNAIIQVIATSTTTFKITTISAYGTWTPNQGVGLTVVGAFSSAGIWSKVGRQVTVSFYVNGATSIAASTFANICTNCPFTTHTITYSNADLFVAGTGASYNAYILSGDTRINNGSVAITAGPYAISCNSTFMV
jgi:hypothetical protein